MTVPWWRRWWVWALALAATLGAWIVTSLSRRSREADDRAEAATAQAEREAEARAADVAYVEGGAQIRATKAQMLQIHAERHRIQTEAAHAKTAGIVAKAAAAGSTAVLYPDEPNE
ncbi:MAG: hypothetical protein ACI9MR_000049 [Myxococcota bacterium]|jgi:hypothetical protein